MLLKIALTAVETVSPIIGSKSEVTILLISHASNHTTDAKVVADAIIKATDPRNALSTLDISMRPCSFRHFWFFELKIPMNPDEAIIIEAKNIAMITIKRYDL